MESSVRLAPGSGTPSWGAHRSARSLNLCSPLSGYAALHNKLATNRAKGGTGGGNRLIFGRSTRLYRVHNETQEGSNGLLADEIGPGSYSWDDLVRDGRHRLERLRNNAARLHLRAMKLATRPSSITAWPRRGVGIMRVTGPGEPTVRTAAVKGRSNRCGPLATPVTLAAIKAEPKLARWN